MKVDELFKKVKFNEILNVSVTKDTPEEERFAARIAQLHHYARNVEERFPDYRTLKTLLLKKEFDPESPEDCFSLGVITAFGYLVDLLEEVKLVDMKDYLDKL